MNNYCVFFQEFSKVCHLSLASTRLLLVVNKNHQPIGVTVHSYCVESFEGLLHSVAVEGGVAVNCEKTQLFLNTLYLSFSPHTSLTDRLVLVWVRMVKWNVSA